MHPFKQQHLRLNVLQVRKSDNHRYMEDTFLNMEINLHANGIQSQDSAKKFVI